MVSLLSRHNYVTQKTYGPKFIKGRGQFESHDTFMNLGLCDGQFTVPTQLCDPENIWPKVYQG